MNNGNTVEETHTTESTDDLNLRRRRLIRGAIGVSPMVLTLRSGALAAASFCEGPIAEAKTTSSGNDGKLAIPATGNEALVGDICVANPQYTGCGTNTITAGDLGTPITPVTRGSGNGTNGSDALFCNGTIFKTNGNSSTVPVAIISGLAGTSLI